MEIYKPLNASILSIIADVSASMHDVSLLGSLAQTLSNSKTIFKDRMHHFDLKRGVIRDHG